MQNTYWSLFIVLAASLGLASCGQSKDENAVNVQNGVDASAGQSPSEKDIPDDANQAEISGPKRHILAFGDSLFAGYGLKREQSYPAQLQDALRKKGMDAHIVNAGVSGDTSAAGQQRLAFTLDAQSQKPDLIILELGGNDLLRGVKPAETRKNFIAMLDELSRRKIPVLLMGLRAPPNYGPEFSAKFDAIFPEMEQKYDLLLVPFFLESLIGKPQLLQDDHIHPTKEGIQTLVDNTAHYVEEIFPKGASSIKP